MEKEKIEYTYDGISTHFKKKKWISIILIFVALTVGLASFLSSVDTIEAHVKKSKIGNEKNSAETAVVISERAHFYTEPDVSTKKDSYVIKGQEVKYTRISGDFIYGSYTNDGGKETHGWLLKSQFKF